MSIDKKLQRDVLIIDDEKDICEILKVYCENMGCFKNIVMAHDGITATQKLRNQKFALVCLDISLPKKSGYDLIGDVEAGNINSKDNILVVSGTLEKDLIAKILASGVKNFMVKPFDEKQFQEKVLRILSTTKTEK
ncbi:response regulator [Bacteriovorax sp. PP10]|uniref:Response regulator n=1 Tax=Bacteriovorax antarcticus TaxID=3088717 RepID=A0ABU5VZN0_9BACT|nr:response regulator [Bacteriovorax sp. PP10]MEA9358528.1 response regulator [Bacteriovorax sp. PP10]